MESLSKGASALKILANCDDLEDLTPPECFPLINCLQSFGKVMAATFGEDLSPHYDDVIKRFGSAFSKVMSNFGIRMTPKVRFCTSSSSPFYPFDKYAPRTLFRTSCGRATCQI